MGSFAVSERNKMLNAFIGSANYATVSASVWMKLHTGTAGTDGTANAYGDTRRVQVLYTNSAANGTVTNTANADLTNVTSTQTVTDISLWSASTGGTFLGEDTLSSTAPLTAGDTFRVATSDLDLSIS